MKILLVSLWAISDKAVGGTERFTIDLANTLTAAGHSVDVLMLSGKSTELNDIAYHSLDIMGNSEEADEYILEQRFGKINNSSALEKIGRYLEMNYGIDEYDAIQFNSLLFLAAWSDHRRVFTIHTNPYEFDLNWGAGGFEFICKWISENAPTATAFTAPSQTYANQYQQLMKRPVTYIPHAIDPERVIYKGTKAQDLRTKYQLPDSYIVLMPSRLDMEQKRPQLALGALIKARENLPELVAIFTGVDKQYAKNIERLKEQAEKGGIKTKFIRFENMTEAYKLSDLVVLPSRSESFGYSALEALTVPRRTILSAIPSYCEIAEGNKNAYIAGDTVNELAVAITQASNTAVTPTPAEWTSRYSFAHWAQEYLNIFGSKNYE